MMDCGIPQLIAIFAALAFAMGGTALADTMRAADPKPSKYSVQVIFSADFCGPCKALEAHLRKHGYPVKVTEVTEQPAVASFPTVYYVGPDGRMHSDNGQQIYNWQAEPPANKQPVQIILWRTKE